VRVVIAPQEFKGSLTASEAAAAIAAAVRETAPNAVIDEAPVSDGGAGLVDCMLAARGGERMSAHVHDPLLRGIDAHWARLDDGVAVLEVAAASGLVLVAESDRNPLITTSYGTGELLLAAVAAGCKSVVVGVGGSATVDAGAGVLTALGARLIDEAGNEIPSGGAALSLLDRIDLAKLDRRLARTEIRVACDVTNTLCGPTGAAAVFGPQKGASPSDVPRLDDGLRRFADVARRDYGVDLIDLPGGGAAGGIAAGLALIGASVEPGFPIVADAINLDARIAGADLVITGEGRLDAQTAFGKAAGGVASLARRHGKPVIAVAGVIGDDLQDRSPWDLVETAAPASMPAGEAMRRGAELLQSATVRVLNQWTSGR
jgi:glycerate kinase